MEYENCSLDDENIFPSSEASDEDSYYLVRKHRELTSIEESDNDTSYENRYNYKFDNRVNSSISVKEEDLLNISKESDK
jgi:hypothetical protein